MKIEAVNVAPLPLTVSILEGGNPSTPQSFTDGFNIGRDESCSIRINQGKVSRIHAEVFVQEGSWWIRDLQSTNGTYLNGSRIDSAVLTPRSEIGLGLEGPRLLMEIPVETSMGDEEHTVIQSSREPSIRGKEPVISPGSEDSNTGIDTKPELPLEGPGEVARQAQEPPFRPADPNLSYFVRRYFQDNGEAGEQTMMIRRAFHQVQTKERKKYTNWVVAAVLVGLAALGFGIYKAIDHARQEQKIREQQAQIEELEGKARQIFYQMKQLELTVGPSPAVTQLKQQYDAFVDELGVYDSKSDEEKLIYRMARMFGECDVDMPPEFVEKVREYIGYWRSTGRYRQAVDRARQNGYTFPIVRTFLEHDLPPQFFYLAMQESGFNVNAVGPLTRYGYAKGMWQFIEMTANRYHLQTGPLVFNARPDPLDDRHNFEKSTRAAAEYIRDIYVTDAQASGLLVFASYNWGEHNVLSLIRRLPENPGDRNFWKLLEKYEDKIPQETYNYVFYIFAAAVIGENPRLFGFDFDNPLSEPIRQVERSPSS